MNTTAVDFAGGPPGNSYRPPRYGIIAFSHLRWNFVWQRPQQFLSRFAAKHPVLFVEEPEFSLELGQIPRVALEEPQFNITVARLILPRGFERNKEFERIALHLILDTVDGLSDDGAFDAPLLWFYNPMDAPWAIGAFNERGVVYDCMDELSQFKFAPKELVANEKFLLSKADIVFTGGYELWLKKKAQHPNAYFFGCGVEYDHFAKAQMDATEIPADLKPINHPILGWFGVIDERMDYDLLARIAELKPEWSFVMVGPVMKVDPDSLPDRANIHWMGQRTYAELPNCCKAFDICMMCFAINEATEFINPTKALEYLATGRPVISTPVKDVVRQYNEYVFIARSPEEFVEQAEQVLSHRPDERIAKGIDKAQRCSWESTVAEMQELIEAAIASVEDQAERSTKQLF